MSSTSPKHGFTLVELSIVLVILGLLVGGVLTGQSLIRAAELRAVATESSRFTTATYTFRDKYFALPGDMPNATAYWGRAAATGDCVTNSSAAVSTAGVCDGNGNGALSSAGAGQYSEVFQYWTQLAKAGLIEGTYTGMAGSGGVIHGIAGTNIPKSKLANAAWGNNYLASYGGTANDFGGTYNNYYIFGAPYANSMPYNGILDAGEAYNIDVKTDDGKPATGKILLNWRATCAISTGSMDTAATYNLSVTTKSCGLFFVNIP